MSKNIGLVVGSTGITGQSLARLLASQKDWLVYGLARKPLELGSGINSVAADLLDKENLHRAISKLGITHVFFGSWMKMENEAKNCEVNGLMLSNLLDAVQNPDLKNVSLVTGGKHYFGSFEDSGNFEVITPYREEQDRKPGLNFYYTQEDILFERARSQGFNWNVHRPQTIVGYALGNAMNMGVTLAVYAHICKETGRPFVFPGSPTIYNGIADATDARILASQLHWAVSTPAAANQAFNITNGDVYRWSWMWPQIAGYFGLVPEKYPGHENPLDTQMRDAGPVWDKIVAKHGLQPKKIGDLVSWWHTDSDLSRTFETFSDMSKSRKLGFLEYRKTTDSFFQLFDQLRSEKVIP
jgi:nucleoside-diphosphate-sugar epimerase